MSDDHELERALDTDDVVDPADVARDESSGYVRPSDIHPGEYINSDANPADGWTPPHEGHTEPPIDRDGELRRKGSL